MNANLLRTALMAEATAILLSRYATPQAKALWLVAAGVIYWLIARGIRSVHALQFMVTAGGLVVTVIAGAWAAVAYAVEVGALAILWRQERHTRESG